MQETDSAAVARAQEGDGDAYRMLVERHSRGVFRLAYRLTGNQQDAEDVVQETLLKAFRQIKRYESRASFATWLRKIAANCSLDLIRSRKRGQDETVMDILEGHEPGPDRLTYSSQIQSRVTEAMNQLTQQERTAFVLRHFEGQSIKEISAALGLNANAAKHSIFRAVQKLRRALEPVVAGNASCNT